MQIKPTGAKGTLYAYHGIPRKARPLIGKSNFVKSLETTDWHRARILAAPLEVDWRRQIAEALEQPMGQPEADAKWWRKAITQTRPEDQEFVRLALHDELRDRLEAAGRKAGINPDDEGAEEALLALPECADARKIFGLVDGTLKSLTEHLEEYLATLKITGQSAYNRKKDIEAFAKRVPYISDAARKGVVQSWADERAKTVSPGTIAKARKNLKQYWAWLQNKGHARDGVNPFSADRVSVHVEQDLELDDKGRVNWSERDVQRLYRAACDGYDWTDARGRAWHAEPDLGLADAIAIAAYCGRRSGGIANVRVSDLVADDGQAAVDGWTAFWSRSKTGTGLVPIHPHIRPIFARRLADARDGYLFHELRVDAVGIEGGKKDRTRAKDLSERFTELKQRLGYDRRYVFHNFRGTVSQKLIARLGSEKRWLVQTIVGHKDTSETTGRYANERRMAPEDLAERMKLKHEAIRALDWSLGGAEVIRLIA